jgi:hypothetical protein
MDRIDTLGAVGVAPVYPAADAAPGYFQGKDVVSGTKGTRIGPLWLTAVQEEIMGVILAVGLIPARLNFTQLLQAIKQLVAGGLPAGAAGAWVVTANLNLSSAKRFLPCNATGGAINLTLGAANTFDAPHEFHIGKILTDVSANAITLVGTVNGEVNPTITVSGDFRKIKCIPDANLWIWS